MKKFRSCVVLLVAVVLLLSTFVPVLAHATTVNTSEDERNPYVTAYLNQLAEENGTQSYAVENVDQDDTIASLDNYYRKDCELAELLQEMVTDGFNLSKVTSIEKDDKIDAMHYMAEMYLQISDADCLELINDYFRRYAVDSGDSFAIEFYDTISEENNFRELIVNTCAVGVATDKSALEEIVESQRSSVSTYSTASYDDNFSSTKAAEWAYDNYNKYSTDFPAFTGSYGSDCTNFVSQALYNGGMEMHDTWYCTKLNDTYLIPESATQLDYSWKLADPSPWISVDEFVSFWGSKSTYYEYTKDEYLEDQMTAFAQPIMRGDVVILYSSTLWWSSPAHAMIISQYDAANYDYLLAAHSRERRDYPLSTAITSYAKVRFYCP